MGVVIIGILLVGGGFLLFSNRKPVLSSPSQNTDTTKNRVESQISSSPTPATKTYTLEEIATHNLETDCWLAIEGKVYDVTEFIPNHPGGKAVLAGCGKDATTLFNDRPTNNKGPHPAQAITQLEKLFIGDLRQE